jgi:GNAT superfamily N-acetyltransferase
MSPSSRAWITGSPARRPHAFGEGEIETLYVLDDWRERGLGRRLMQASATWLGASGCGSAFLWVLRDNPSRWFYERLGGKAAAEQLIRVAGRDVVQTAYVWAPIDKLVQATTSAP